MGAKFAPCMRHDDRVYTEVIEPIRERETQLVSIGRIVNVVFFDAPLKQWQKGLIMRGEGVGYATGKKGSCSLPTLPFLYCKIPLFCVSLSRYH